MTCGIYILYWSIDYPYIGQSVNFSNRKTKHLSEIRTHSHCNSKITSQYIETGMLPSIELLEECSYKDLNTLEESYIKEFNSIDHGLNIASGGKSVGIGVNNPKSKYTREQLIDVFNYLIDPNKSFTDISILTNVNRSTINQVANGHQHIWLQEEFPEIFIKIKESQLTRSSLVQTVEHKGTKYPEVISPDGVTHSIKTSLDTFCKVNNLQNTNMYKLFKGKITQHKGWVLSV